MSTSTNLLQSSPMDNILKWARPTRHFESRVNERGLRADVLEYIFRWAEPVYRSGLVFLAIRRKDLPERERNSKIASRAMGWVLGLAHDESLVTAYRRCNAVSYLKKKPRRALHPKDFDNRRELQRLEQAADHLSRKANRKHRTSAHIERLIPFSPSAA